MTRRIGCLLLLLLCLCAGCRTAQEDPELLSNRYNSELNTLLYHWGTYPDYYAGAYIRDGKLTILVTSRDPEIARTIRSVTGDPSIRVRTVRHSYAELDAIRSRIQDAVFDMEKRRADSRLDAFVGLSIDEPGNRVVVEVMKGTLTRREIDEILGKDSCVAVVYKDEPYIPKNA